MSTVDNFFSCSLSSCLCLFQILYAFSKILKTNYDLCFQPIDTLLEQADVGSSLDLENVGEEDALSAKIPAEKR